MPDEPQETNENPFVSPKPTSAQPTSGSPTLRIVAVIFLATATAVALPIVFLTVCVAVVVGGNNGGVDPGFSLITAVVLATLAVGLLVFAVIRLGIWLLQPRRPVSK